MHINDNIAQRLINYPDFTAGEAELCKFFKATQQVSAWIYNSQICLLLSPAGHADSLWNVYFQQTLKGQEESKGTKGTVKVSINSKKQMFSATQNM